MTETYVLKQMVSLAHTPFQIVNRDGSVELGVGMRNVERLFYEKNHQMIAVARERAREYPVIFAEKRLLFAVFPEDPVTGQILLAGPVVSRALSREQLIEVRREWNMGKTDYQPPVTSIKKMVSMMLLLHWQSTGVTMSVDEFWKKNRKNYQSGQEFERRLSRELFQYQENVGLHNPYEQELREMNSITNGDMEALSRSMSETYEGEIGILAKDPLRSAKNVAIGNITLASRAAIRGGMSTEKSFFLADIFSQQVEEIENLPEVEAFKREIKFTYARMVKEEKNNEIVEGENQVNPLIAQVKDYVFHHLHGAIQVQDIAQALQVNPDYLSHLFSTSENITMIEYIRQEKVRRGENLLRYSDYRVQDIAFYLGFSSQSHFARIFQKTTGMNPNEYRKTFGNKKKWKTKASESTQKNQEEKK